KFFTVPKVAIFHSLLKPHAQLVAAKVEFIAIDERPERPAAAWKFARESSPLERRRVRLPARAREEIRERPFDPGNSTERLGIAVVHAVPDSPDVLPAFVTDAVKKSVLEVVGLVAGPAVADVHHVARLEPFVLADHGNKRKFPVAPSQIVPGQRFVGWPALGLERQRMSDLVRGDAECARDAAQRVAVQAVRSDGGKGTRCRVPIRLTHVARPLVPQHYREQNPDAAAVKVLNRLAQSLNAARHIAKQVVLVAIINADIRVSVPDEDRSNSTVALFECV